MDPQLKASLERIITIYLTYLVTKYGSGIPGLSGLIPDLIVVGGSALSVAYGAYINRKSAIVAAAAAVPEVNKIELSPTVAGNELAKSTPPNVVVKQ